MIRVEVRSNTHGGPQGLTLAGHAGGVKGTDIVCAAVSVLIENLGESLQVLLGIPVRLEKDAGYYSIDVPEYPADSLQGQKVELLLKSTLLGLGHLAELYPDRVSIE